MILKLLVIGLDMQLLALQLMYIYILPITKKHALESINRFKKYVEEEEE
ncbi:hypothetical protein AB3U99_10350 [Niallia sp. JL1B1071]